MLKIRLQRAGRKNLPHYRIVLAEHSSPVKGKFIEKLGHYDPRTKAVGLKTEAILGWLQKGATPSNTAAKILIANGLKHKNVVFEKQTPRKPKTAEKIEPKQKEIKEPAPEALVEEPKAQVQVKEEPPSPEATAAEGSNNG